MVESATTERESRAELACTLADCLGLDGAFHPSQLEVGEGLLGFVLGLGRRPAKQGAGD